MPPLRARAICTVDTLRGWELGAAFPLYYITKYIASTQRICRVAHLYLIDKAKKRNQIQLQFDLIPKIVRTITIRSLIG